MKLLKSGHNYLASHKRKPECEYCFRLTSVKEEALRFTPEEAEVLARFLSVTIVDEVPSFVIEDGERLLYSKIEEDSTKFFFGLRLIFGENPTNPNVKLVRFETIQEGRSFIYTMQKFEGAFLSLKVKVAEFTPKCYGQSDFEED
jgi:hypothetical protein